MAVAKQHDFNRAGVCRGLPQQAVAQQRDRFDVAFEPTVVNCGDARHTVVDQRVMASPADSTS